MPVTHASLAAELKWLQAHPEFNERPASITEFFGPDYLNIADKIRPGVRDALVEIFGEEVDGKTISHVRLAMFTGAIGIGKTTLASIALPYMCHWVLCLKDPQDFFNLMPGSRIAFMQMSTSEDQAKQVIFGDIKARIEYSPWFTEKFPFDPSFKNQVRFEKDIWILPGDSAETTFEGYNILGGILDEADSHKITKDRDYAEEGYNTIDSRINSRFRGLGLLIVIGQMKKAVGFARKKFDEFRRNPEACVVRMTIWESLGWKNFLKPDGSRDSFFYDAKRKQIITEELAAAVPSEDYMEIPSAYRRNFENNPEKALRDLAGIPPAVGDPFISLTYKVEEAVDRWQLRQEGIGSPVSTEVSHPKFEDWFTATDRLKRAIHIDFAYSSDGDALGLAMGHVRELIEVEGEEKPYIIIDFLLRMHAAPGTEIMFSDVRRTIYELTDDRKFRIKAVTMDGFQSTDTMQQLRKRRYYTDYVSVDKSKLPYEDLREALYEDRIEFPPYMTYLRHGDGNLINILYKELTELQDTGKKIDHQPTGSKDVADAVAGVVYTLMGDRTYRRGVGLSDTSKNPDKLLSKTPTVPQGFDIDQLRIPAGTGMQAPVPPTIPGSLGFAIPKRLQPPREER